MKQADTWARHGLRGESRRLHTKNRRRFLEKQARWLFDFASGDLTPLRKPSLHQIARDLEAWMNADVEAHATRSMVSNIDHDQISELHGWLRAGFQDLAEGRDWTIMYDSPPRYIVCLDPPYVSRRIWVHRAIIPFKQMVFEDIIPIFLRQLRVCVRASCTTLFWRRGRQRFCSPQCAGRRRSASWRQRYPERVKASRRKSHVKRQRARTSPRARVEARPRSAGPAGTSGE